MKQKNIKVAYTSRCTGGSYTQVPKIQMEGRWLEELGFSIGSTIVVAVSYTHLVILSNSSLVIRPASCSFFSSFCAM